MSKNRKGFTIVELVIVIAVIAILASVLVPTFSDVILKAKRNADTQVVRMLNEDVAMDLASSEKSKHDTMYQAVQACIEYGISPDKIAAKSDYNIAWESTTGHFVLIDLESSLVIYPVDSLSNHEYTVSDNDKINYFIVTTYDNRIEEDLNYKYSVYAFGNDWPEEIEIHTGFDIGSVSNIKKIEYSKSIYGGSAVIINTNAFNTKLVIKDIVDDVNHFGSSYLVELDNTTPYLYNEYGNIGRLKLAHGTLNCCNYSNIYCLMNLNNSEVIIEDYANISSQVKDINPSIENNKKDDLGIAHCQINVCEYHDDNNSILLTDNQNQMFCVCKTCGSTISGIKTPEIDSNDEVTGVIRYGYSKDSSFNKECNHNLEYVKLSSGSCSNANGGIEEYKCTLCNSVIYKDFSKDEHNWVWSESSNCYVCKRNTEKKSWSRFKLNEWSVNTYDGTIKANENLYSSSCGKGVIFWGEGDGGYLVSSVIDFAYTDVVVANDKVKLDYCSLQFEDTLLTVELKEGITKIGRMDFYNCKNLKYIKLPDSLTTIDGGAFSSCPSLKKLVIPKNVSSIDVLAFYRKDTEIELDSENPYFYYDHDCLMKKDTMTLVWGNNEGYIPEGTKIIGEYAYNNYAISSINIPSTVEEIGYDAFSDCLNVTELVIPSNVKKVAELAFEVCESLTSVTINSVDIILENYVFYRCSMLTEITFVGTKAQWNTIINNSGSECLSCAKITIIHCSDGDIELN